MTDLRELLQECHAEILFWLPHRDSPPNRSRLLLERIDATLAHPPTVPTRNAQGEVDGGYFAEGPRMPSEHPLYEKVGPEQRGPQPAAPPTYAGPMWQPPEDWLKDHEIPALGSALQKLGSHLADMLSEDDWNNIEQMLFAVARESAAPVAAAQPPDANPEPKWCSITDRGIVTLEDEETGEVIATGLTPYNAQRILNLVNAAPPSATAPKLEEKP
jgi:hypothetical protein